MLILIDNLPEQLLGVSAEGRVTEADYQEILLPALDQRLEKHDKINLLFHLGERFTRFTTTALWDDARLGFHHMHDFRRVAVVTDVAWLKSMVTAANKLAQAQLRVFANSELASAREWLSN